MQLRVRINEISYGNVLVNVPEGATDDQIYEAAYNEYCEGRAFFGSTDIDIVSWEEE